MGGIGKNMTLMMQDAKLILEEKLMLKEELVKQEQVFVVEELTRKTGLRGSNQYFELY